MVISDVNRYIFIEVPQTASTALAAELIENYGGYRIFDKHADYMQFYRSASEDERSYRVLATVRNPLDIVVSKFIKARDDHRNAYASTKIRNAPWGHRFRPEAREFAFISKHGPDFEAFTRKFYRFDYNSRACLLPEQTRVLKFEQLNQDFSNWLTSIDLSLVRPLPHKHVTGGRGRDFTDWYQGELRLHVVRVFGPYMLRWGYKFPADWPNPEVSEFRMKLFDADTLLRRFYFRRIHNGWVMPTPTRDRKHRADKARELG